MDRRDFIKAGLLSLGSISIFPTEIFADLKSYNIRLGIDVLEDEGFKLLQGKNIGLLTNQAGVNSKGESTIQIFVKRGIKAGVKLKKLFGPEHGIYGDIPAEKIVQNQIDRRTGLPVFSLYGSTRKPTPEMLKGLDTFVIDLQDVGTRSYTYISAMRLAVEACFDAGVEVVVLDRPNPLGGEKVDGPMLDKKWESYVGMYPIPYVHGLTIGEIASIAIQKNWLTLSSEARKKGKLHIVKMKNWSRNMRWGHTQLKWVATSPMIPNIYAVEGYAMSGLGTYVGDFSHSYKRQLPFRWITYPNKNDKELVSLINSYRIGGLKAVSMAPTPQLKGAYLKITNWNILRPTEISFHLMKQICIWSKTNPFSSLSKNVHDGFLKHVGDEKFYIELCKKGKNINIKSWCDFWEAQANEFQNECRPFYFYS